MMSMATIIGAIALAAQSGADPAAGTPAALQRLVASPGYQANVARLFATLPPDVFQRCPALVSSGSQVTVITPVSFNDEGYPVTGVWMQRFPVSGCGNDTVINFFFAGQPGGKITSMIATPGRTHAGITLQRDAYRYVSIAAQPAAKDCAALHIRDTRYEGPVAAQPAPVDGKAIGAPWREIWSVAACGAVIDVPVTFIPDATGTTISTKAVGPTGK